MTFKNGLVVVSMALAATSVRGQFSAGVAGSCPEVNACINEAMMGLIPTIGTTPGDLCGMYQDVFTKIGDCYESGCFTSEQTDAFCLTLDQQFSAMAMVLGDCPAPDCPLSAGMSAGAVAGVVIGALAGTAAVAGAGVAVAAHFGLTQNFSLLEKFQPKFEFKRNNKNNGKVDGEIATEVVAPHDGKTSEQQV